MQSTFLFLLKKQINKNSFTTTIKYRGCLAEIATRNEFLKIIA